MRIPEFLRKGDTIGFVAPSYGCNIEPYNSAFAAARDKWKNMGYQLMIGPNCFEGAGIGISNTPQKCGDEINEYFAENGTDVLISCGGGELMCEILDYVDFGKLAKEKPKWFMGFSDNTNMTFLLAVLADTASIYGPCAATFGMEPWHESLGDFMALLEGRKKSFSNYDMWEKNSNRDEEHPYEYYNLTEKTEIKLYKNGDAGIIEADDETEISGRFLGGCLDCLSNLVGTKFDKVVEFNHKYENDGIIWYLEACDLNPMAIRRALWQLKHAGWFDTAKGFIIGRPVCFGEELLGVNHYNAVTDVLAEFNVPIIMDADIGHMSPMMPMVNGAYGTVKYQNNSVSLSFDI